MEDDESTRQRAMDAAAAAVAVAAAAAVHQNQHQHHRHKRDRQDSDFEHKHLQNGEQSFNGYEEADESVRELHEGREPYEAQSVQYLEQPGDNHHMNEIQGTSNRPAAYHTKRRKVNTCLPCKVSVQEAFLLNFSLTQLFEETQSQMRQRQAVLWSMQEAQLPSITMYLEYRSLD